MLSNEEPVLLWRGPLGPRGPALLSQQHQHSHVCSPISKNKIVLLEDVHLPSSMSSVFVHLLTCILKPKAHCFEIESWASGRLLSYDPGARVG